MGLDEAAVAMQIQRARTLNRFNELTSWEHVTTIGFRNRDGQEVIRKTEREGSAPGQRVFILHCTVCESDVRHGWLRHLRSPVPEVPGRPAGFAGLMGFSWFRRFRGFRRF